jgi:hypothetical protein
LRPASARGREGAQNCVHSNGRLRREVARSVDLTTVADGAASQEAQLMARELERALEQVIGTLTDEDRASLGLQRRRRRKRHSAPQAQAASTRATARYLEAGVW